MIIWFIGWLITIGILGEAREDGKTLEFWIIILMLFIWPLMLGVAIEKMHIEKLAVLNEIKKNIESPT